MKGYYKAQVDTHSERFCGPQLPAINVKVHRFPSTYAIADRLGLDIDQEGMQGRIDQALEFWFESAQQRFWEDADEIAARRLGKYIKVYSAGRSGGWLVVEGLPDLETWNAITLNEWALFEREIKAEIDWLCSLDCIVEDIEANRWAEPGASLYNFVDLPEGKTACLVDLRAELDQYAKAAWGVSAKIAA